MTFEQIKSNWQSLCSSFCRPGSSPQPYLATLNKTSEQLLAIYQRNHLINASIHPIFIAPLSEVKELRLFSVCVVLLHQYIDALCVFLGCHWWPLWCRLSFGGPRWNYSLQGDEEAIRQLYLHSCQKWHLQVLLQQWVLNLHAQNGLLWLPGWRWPSTLSQWEQSHCSHPGKLTV